MSHAARAGYLPSVGCRVENPKLLLMPCLIKACDIPPPRGGGVGGGGGAVGGVVGGGGARGAGAGGPPPPPPDREEALDNQQDRYK